MSIWRRYQIWCLSRKLASLRVRQAYLVGKHVHRFPDEADIVRAMCDYDEPWKVHDIFYVKDCYEMQDLCGRIAAIDVRLTQLSGVLPRARVLS